MPTNARLLGERPKHKVISLSLVASSRWKRAIGCCLVENRPAETLFLPLINPKIKVEVNFGRQKLSAARPRFI